MLYFFVNFFLHIFIIKTIPVVGPYIANLDHDMTFQACQKYFRQCSVFVSLLPPGSCVLNCALFC